MLGKSRSHLKKSKRTTFSLPGSSAALVTEGCLPLSKLLERTLHPHLPQRGFCCQRPPETAHESSPRPSNAGDGTNPPGIRGEAARRSSPTLWIREGSPWSLAEQSTVNPRHSSWGSKSIWVILRFQNHNHSVTQHTEIKILFHFSLPLQTWLKLKVIFQQWSRNSMLSVDTEKCPTCHMWRISFQRQDPRETDASLQMGSVSGPPPPGEVPHTSKRPPAPPSFPHPHRSSIHHHVASVPLTLLKLPRSRTISQPFFSCSLRVRDTISTPSLSIAP